jgi:Tol biopolymer transport system component
LTERWGRNPVNPDWSPIEDRILYVSSGTDIHVANLDGSGDGLVLPQAVGPKWSPDGTRIVFMRKAANGIGGWAIWVSKADGSDARQLTVPAGSDDHVNPAWSHDGKGIVFGRSPAYPGVPSLHIMNADGTANRKISPDSLPSTRADW